MPTYAFMQVDAFTDHPLGGNPCAILFDTDDLDVPTMQAIAREMNLSETSFVRCSTVADIGARYFTPAEEIPMAGHPTIATAFALVETGRLALHGDERTFTLELPVGPIPVTVARRDGAVQVTMAQKKPQFLDVFEAAHVMPLFGLDAEDVVPGAPIQTVSTGTPQLMVPVRSLDALRRIRVDLAGLTALREETRFFCVHVFCRQGATPEGRTFARDFAVPPDLFEDPFTGSATGGMGAYLWRYGLIDEPVFVAEQGHWMGRPGRAMVEVVGPRDAIETVRVGGRAATVVRGELTL